MLGIYVHVPFCVRKCGYCDFYSETGDGAAMDRFVTLVSREIELLQETMPHLREGAADTLFFGGGTPTALGAERLCALLSAIRDRFPLTDDAEITTEANPGTVTFDDLHALRKAGFNRLSLGIQSFHPVTLDLLGRIHGVAEIRSAWRDARRAGFTNIGMDLIFGIPGQTVAEWNHDLQLAVTFLPEHLSAYALTPEADTPMGKAIDAGALSMPDESDIVEMYALTRRVLTGAGYRQYEISNFSRPGKECRHNRKYWQREETAALGPAAHGLFFPLDAPRGIRTENPPSLPKYAARLESGRLPWVEPHRCTADDAWTEALIAGLRELEGVDLAEVERRSGPPPDRIRKAVDVSMAEGKFLSENGRLRLPEKLLFVSNEVLSALV